MLKNNTIYQGLSALIITFVLGYLGIIVIHNVFNDIVNDLDTNVKNEYSRYKIGEYILKEIGLIEANYYKIGIVTKLKAIEPIQDKIKSEIKDIRNAVRILENGGVLSNHIKLNLLEKDIVTDNIYFSVDKYSSEYTFEAIDLLPKLDELTIKLSEMEDIMRIRLSNSLNEYHNINDEDAFKVKLFFKQLPTLFTRMQENGSGLLHDSKKNIDLLEKNIKEEKVYYRKLEYLFTFFVMTVVLILGIFVIRQILKKSKELEDISKKAKESENEALQANKAKSQFLANMSHEIRTPLNAIIGFSDILANSSLEEKEKEKANIISKSAKALLNIINDILDISKIESGKFEISKTKFNLPSLLEQVVQLYSINTKQKNIRFFYTLDDKIPNLVISDETKLKQVLSNILSNAIKFTPEGGKVSLSVKLLEEKDNSSKIEFSVKDEGIGISQEYQKKIFEPFSQADGSISRKFGGTGLGLAISMNILKMLGSKIKIKSKENEGSRFFFDLDFKIPKKNIQEKELKYNFALCDIIDDSENIKDHLRFVLKDFGTIYEKEEIDIQESIDMIFCFGDPESFDKLSRRKKRLDCPVVYVGNMKKLENNKMKPLMDYYLDVPIYGSKIFNIIAEVKSIEKENKKDFILDDVKNNFSGKVLVAEDNTNNQLLIELIFKELGLDVCIVENGKLAYEKYQEEDFDLVFLDINMPVIDGLGALKLIRDYEKESKKHTPIIALTANTINGDKEKYLKAGMDFYLSKPIENNELLKILSIYLNKKSVQIKEKKEVKKIDIDVLLVSQKLGISENIAKMIIDKFNSNITKDIKDFEDIISTQDRDKISDKAHYIKNSCLNVSLDKVCEVLEELELKELSIKEVEEKFKKLKTLLFG
jgi:two-component system, NarL family, sensor histidine kinase BarA